MEHIKLICFSDKCIILNPEDKATQNFIFGLKMQFRCEVGGVAAGFRLVLRMASSARMTLASRLTPACAYSTKKVSR